MPPKKKTSASTTSNNTKSQTVSNSSNNKISSHHLTRNADASTISAKVNTTTTTTTTRSISSIGHQHQHQHQQVSQQSPLRFNVQELSQAPWLFDPSVLPLVNSDDRPYNNNNNNNNNKNNNNNTQHHFICPDLVRKIASEVDPTLVFSQKECDDVLHFVDDFLNSVVIGSAKQAKRRSRAERDMADSALLAASPGTEEVSHNNNNDDDDDDDSNIDANVFPQNRNDDNHLMVNRNNNKNSNKGSSNSNNSRHVRTDAAVVVLTGADVDEQAAKLYPKVFASST